MTPETTRQAMSIYDMFAESDIFMKLLILGLIFASVWSWAIIFDKSMKFKRLRERMKSFEEKFWSGGSLENLFTAFQKSQPDPLSAIFVAAMKEWKRTFADKRRTSTLNFAERVEKIMHITIDKQIEKLETKMTFLATTGSVAPLLGLFGTIWGVMDSFAAIGATQSTNIAAVAPGIAEALLTTAVGLIAAIPALIAYNKFSHDIDHMAAKMETFSDEFTAILSRQIEVQEEKQ